DVVRGNHGLDVRGKPATARLHVEAFIRKMHGDTPVNEIAEISPVFEIARAAINLVDDDGLSFAFIEAFEHIVEDRSAAFRRGFPFFKPVDNLKAVAFNKPKNRILLLLK